MTMFFTLSSSFTNDTREVVAVETDSSILATSNWSTCWGGGGGESAIDAPLPQPSCVQSHTHSVIPRFPGSSTTSPLV